MTESFNSFQFSMPVITAQQFSLLAGLPLGVVDAQLDRRILPCIRFGKYRFVNLEALRLIAVQAHEVSA
jgi:hypothetical protein